MPAPRATTVTLNDVARVAAVSRRVASAIVNDEPRGNVFFSEATRVRVLSAVQQVGYRPNRTAVNLLRRRHGTVGLLVSEVDRIPAGLQRQLLTRFKARDQLLVMEQLPADGSIPDLLKADCVDGLLLFESASPAVLEVVARQAMPVLQINTNQRHGPGCLSYDEEGAADVAARTFAERGCRRPALLLPDTVVGHYSETLRFTALQAAAARHGLHAPLCWRSTDTWMSTCSHTRALLAQHPEIDAVLVYFEILATPVYEAAAQLGRRVPTDLAVISYNDSHVARAVLPRLTTVSVDGDLLAERILALLEHAPDATPAPMPFHLTRRESA